jgi:hypothetical protein
VPGKFHIRLGALAAVVLCLAELAPFAALVFTASGKGEFGGGL